MSTIERVARGGPVAAGAAGFVAGDDGEAGGDAAVGDGDAGVGGSGEGGGDAGDDFKRYPAGAEVAGLFAAAAEDEGVAALEAADRVTRRRLIRREVR